MNLDWIQNPAWWTLIVSGLSAIAATISAVIARRNARTARAVARVCHVDLQMTPGDEDDYSYHAHDIRRARITNHGDEIAYKVTLDKGATNLKVGEVKTKTLNKGDWLEFDFHPPSVKLPAGAEEAELVDYSNDYGDMGISHTFHFTFQRDKDLEGDIRERTFRYEDVYGHRGKLPGGDDA
ncbi:hypothetical protein Q7689_00510 [Nocardiopsis tropica]|uniref:hypothetical protein n=1 Tax=Nocardiopsis tropica TaxID=109330 RepID=UPI002E8884A0|nr:hypothetical protein [Nocardiopsis tropica]